MLYPFIDAERLDEDLYRGLTELFASFGPFDATFRRVGWFPDVAYLEPEPAAPFRELTAAVFARWPDHPPYEGIFDDVIPHLTVAQTDDTGVLERVGAAVATSLPITATVQSVELWTDSDGGTWHERRRFPLSG